MFRYLLIIFFAIAAPAMALEVREHIWGFAGEPVPEVFNPLSVLLVNSSETPFNGEVTLFATEFTGRVGAKYVETVYLAPHGQRWVQFYPYVDRVSTWMLSLGEGWGARTDVSIIKLGTPARVLLSNPDDPFAEESEFKRFSDNLFPPTVSATDPLASVLLDHVPRWEPVRRTAFLDWLRRGGTLHLLLGADGKYPAFSDELAVLNISSDRQRIGNGEIIRHAVSRGGVRSEMLGDRLPTAPGVQHNYGNGFDEGMFQQLALVTRPKIQWALIYLLAFAYLAIIGPGHYVWSRKRKSRVTLAGLLCCVSVFGLAFMYIGRRGYHGVSTGQAIAWARPVGDGRFDVMQWSTAFVTHGDLYPIQHPGAHNLYAVKEGDRAINATITSENSGKLIVDIPRNSSRGYLHRAVLPGDDLHVGVVEWEADGKLNKLVLAPAAGFPKEVVIIWARFGKRFYQMKLESGQIVLADYKQEEEEFAKHWNVGAMSRMPYESAGEESDSLSIFKQEISPLICRITGLTDSPNQSAPSAESLPDDCIELFVAARSPESFHPTGKGFEKAEGYVIYDQRIYKTDLSKP